MKTGDFEGIQFDDGGDDNHPLHEDDTSLPLGEIYGTEKSGESKAMAGQPWQASNQAHDAQPIRYYFYPTWRSQLLNLGGFLVLSFLTVVLSRQFDWLIVPGSLFSLGDTTYYLYLPLLSLLPGVLLGKILINIYDAKYVIDDKGVEAQIGLMSLSLRQPRLRWEDIRGVEPNQTIWERILGIGSVAVGSAMSGEVEIVMEGVANPRAIQLLIGAERERRLRELQASGNAAIKHMVAYSE